MREGNAGDGGMESQNRKDRVEDWIQDVLRYRIEDKDKKRVLARCADIEAYGQEKNDSRLLGFAFFIREKHITPKIRSKRCFPELQRRSGI